MVYLRIVIFFCIISIFFSSCKKDSDDSNGKNGQNNGGQKHIPSTKDSSWYYINTPVDTDFASYFGVFDSGSFWIYVDGFNAIKDSIFCNCLHRISSQAFEDTTKFVENRNILTHSSELGVVEFLTQTIIDNDVSKTLENRFSITVNGKSDDFLWKELDGSYLTGKGLKGGTFKNNVSIINKNYTNVIRYNCAYVGDSIYFAKNIGMIARFDRLHGNRYLARYHLVTRKVWKK